MWLCFSPAGPGCGSWHLDKALHVTVGKTPKGPGAMTQSPYTSTRLHRCFLVTSPVSRNHLLGSPNSLARRVLLCVLVSSGHRPPAGWRTSWARQCWSKVAWPRGGEAWMDSKPVKEGARIPGPSKRLFGDPTTGGAPGHK